MKIDKLVALVIIAVFLFVDWLAFHDILKGETHTFAEWLTLLGSFLVFFHFGKEMLKKSHS